MIGSKKNSWLYQQFSVLLNHLILRLLPKQYLAIRKKYNQTQIETKKSEFNAEFLKLTPELELDWLNYYKREIQMPKFQCTSIPEGVLLPGGLIIVDGKLLMESCLFQEEYLYKLGMTGQIRQYLKPVEKEIHGLLSLDFVLARNYFHWTLEGLLRLSYFLSTEGISPETITIGISNDAPPFIEQSLAGLFGLNSDQLLVVDSKIRMRNSYLPAFPHIRSATTGFVNIYESEAILQLNKRADLLRDSNKDYPKRIFISRASADNRKIINEEAFCTALNLTSVKLEELDFNEQVALFIEVELVVATHGAGLTNIIYARSRPTIVELFPANRNKSHSSCFIQLSQTLKFEHHFLIVDSIDPAGNIMADGGILKIIKNLIN